MSVFYRFGIQSRFNVFSVTTLLNKSRLSGFLNIYIQINRMTFNKFSQPQPEIYQEISLKIPWIVSQRLVAAGLEMGACSLSGIPICCLVHLHQLCPLSFPNLKQTWKPPLTPLPPTGPSIKQSNPSHKWPGDFSVEHCQMWNLIKRAGDREVARVTQRNYPSLLQVSRGPCWRLKVELLQSSMNIQPPPSQTHVVAHASIHAISCFVGIYTLLYPTDQGRGTQSQSLFWFHQGLTAGL